MQKRCPKCNITKNAGEFHKSKQTKSGLQCYCKLCRNEDKRKYREANLDQIREKSREYYQANRDRINAYTKQYYRDNIDRYKEWHAEYRGKEETKKYKREWMKKNRALVTAAMMYAEFNLSPGDLRYRNYGYVLDKGKPRFVIHDISVSTKDG